jgi:serine/threonine protein kinase/basic membrane lipoprotein Med (substrate-binding protein (PBP1-ABC) superfamily)
MSEHDPLIGRTIGQYKILERVGRGGMATIYRAEQPSVNRVVALKVLPRQFTHDPDFTTRFEREARVIAALEHMNIVPVHDYGQEDDIPYIVMRYMPAGSLAERIREGPPPLDETVRIVAQVADALDYAHEQGVIHRDLKSSNILLDARGNAYLTDFGIAKVAEMTAHLTGSAVVGTPAYMAPEQAEGGAEITPAADIYALGIVIYEMLVGRVPFYDETPVRQLVMHLTEPVPSLRQADPNIPEAIDLAVQRALSKDPTERYPTASAFAEALARAAHLPADVMPVVAPPEPALAAPTPAAPPTPAIETAATEASPDETPSWATMPTALETRLAPARKERSGLLIGLILVGLALVGLLLIGGLRVGRQIWLRRHATPVEPAIAAGETATAEAATAAAPTPEPAALPAPVALVLDDQTEGVNDLALAGARQAAEEIGLELTVVTAEGPEERDLALIQTVNNTDAGLVISVSHMPSILAVGAMRDNRDTHLVLVDVYTAERRLALTNVTVVNFAEDQTGYLAGTLAACMSQTDVIGAVGGTQIPPVVHYVEGYRNGALAYNPDVTVLSLYIPDLNNPALGKQSAQEMIANNADVIFAAAGETGLGALLAASEAGVMAIGADADEYRIPPEVAPSLLTSAVKRYDVAIAQVMRDFAAGRLEGGRRVLGLAEGAVELAPYHDWEGRIPEECRSAVSRAQAGLSDGSLATGVEE